MIKNICKEMIYNYKKMTPNTNINRIFINYLCTKACDCKFYCKNSIRTPVNFNDENSLNTNFLSHKPIINNKPNSIGQSCDKNIVKDESLKSISEEQYFEDKSIEFIYKN